MYNVRLYYDTGFNSINIPDSDALLESIGSGQNFPAVDLLQNTNLQSVRIRATFNEVKDSDFCCIFRNSEGTPEKTDAFYYFVEGFQMLGIDVAELVLTPDYITSAGGPTNLEYTDGIARRAHVTSDGYGDWNLDDDYLTPSEPLILDTYSVRFTAGGTWDVVESSIDLPVMSRLVSAFSYKEATGAETVTVPRSVPNVKTTTYTMDGNQGGETRTGLFLFGPSVKNGIEQCRALGIENTIMNTAYIPKALVSMVTETETAQNVTTSARKQVRIDRDGTPVGYINYAELEDPGNEGVTITATAVATASGNFVTNQTDMAFVYANVNNMRVLYGGLNRVGILTTSGDKLESKPEDIRGGSDYISVKSVGDPHTNGAAYHRFPYMNGDSSNIGFWRNAVKGLPWKQIPIIYTEKRGNALDRIQFENAREIADFEYYSKPISQLRGGTALSMRTRDIETGETGTAYFKNILKALGEGAKGIGGRIAGAGATAIVGPINNPAERYAMQKQQELENFAVGQSAVSPDIAFGYDGEAFRDFYGECVIVYRYRLTDTDLARLDKILTMYGYRVNVPVSRGLFSGRQYFNYVEGSVTVSRTITEHLPRWWCEGIAAQMGTGVRVWHVKPDPSYYNNNPIV